MGKDVGEGARRRALASAVTSWAGPALTLRRTQTGREAWLAPVSGIHVSKAGGGGRPNGRGPSGGGSGGSRPLPGPGAGEPANALGLMDGRWGPEHGIRPTGQTPRETGENPPPGALHRCSPVCLVWCGDGTKRNPGVGRCPGHVAGDGRHHHEVPLCHVGCRGRGVLMVTHGTESGARPLNEVNEPRLFPRSEPGLYNQANE